jgi:outer membrane lipoprotein
MRLAGWRNCVRLACAVALVTSACTSVKFADTENRLEVSPQELTGMDPESLTGTVVWGGRILETANLATGTELLVLAVPLSGGNVPRVDGQSLGRFIAVHPGYLEPLDFAPGRYVSLAGRLGGISDAWEFEGDPVALPVVDIRQIHLWPRDPASWQTRFSLGVAIDIHN